MDTEMAKPVENKFTAKVRKILARTTNEFNHEVDILIDEKIERMRNISFNE